MPYSTNNAANAPCYESGKFAVLDVETTGLNPGRGDRAIEIGISLYSDGIEIDTFSSLINPGMPIDSFITDLTGISDEMVASAPSAKKVMHNALDFVGDAQLVAHNAGFDRKFWRSELLRELGINDEREFLCTLMLSKRIFQSFASHKLEEIAQELRIKSVPCHRALADAQVTAQILFVMIERLRAAHPSDNINAHFLQSYQKRSKTNLPDLTTQQYIESAIQQLASPQPDIRKHQTAVSIGNSANAKRADDMNADAQRIMHELEQLLERTLTADVKLDWDSLAEAEPFVSTIPRRPFIIYDEHGAPTDVDYLKLTEPKPEEPPIEARPFVNDFAPRLRFIHKLTLQKRRLQKEAQAKYLKALQRWKLNREYQLARYFPKLKAWNEAAASIDSKNNERYQQCLEDQKQWQSEKSDYELTVENNKELIKKLKNDYEKHDTIAVEKYVTEVLSRSVYPNYFPDDVVVQYRKNIKAIGVWIKTIQPDDLPTVSSVAYLQTRDEIHTEELSAAAQNTLYANVVRAVAVRTLHEVIESDKVNAVNQVLVQVCVDTVDLSKGFDEQRIIASVQAWKNHLADLSLDKTDPASCFDNLGGRGTTRSISRLSSVDPFKFEETEFTVLATL